MAPPAKSSRSIPWPYKLFFLWIEPIATAVGAYFAFFQPRMYLELTHFASAPQLPGGAVPVGSQIVLAQLANMYMVFALNEAFVLRATTDLRVWRIFLLGLLVADFGHLYSVRDVPGVYWNVHKWNAIDWGNVGFVYGGATMRTLFLLGLGL